MAVVTISREPGALGEEVAARLCGLLGFLLVDKAHLAKLWNGNDLNGRLQIIDERLPGKEPLVDSEIEASVRRMHDLLAPLAEENDVVVIGRGAQALFQNCPGTLHVRITASRSFRVEQVKTREVLSSREARLRLRDLERERSRYIRRLYGLNWADPSLYDLTLRMDRLSVEQAIQVIVSAAHEMKILDVPRGEIVATLLNEGSGRKEGDPFANDAEREFARFLDFYHIPYLYEPRTFPLEIDPEGKVLEAFTPDFYLCEQDLFIELTIMKQSLVTRKNRKLRKLRRLYPEVNIRLFYQRDFYNLMAKFGLLAANKQT
jgi:cytidylate kinase